LYRTHPIGYGRMRHDKSSSLMIGIRHYRNRARWADPKLRRALEQALGQAFEHLVVEFATSTAAALPPLALVPVGGRPSNYDDFVIWLAEQQQPLKSRGKREAMKRFGISERTLWRWLAKANNR
jgi:hypothetical protein